LEVRRSVSISQTIRASSSLRAMFLFRFRNTFFTAEWGPLVYGVQEAATYYFKKRPSQLTAEESIFLASIIPKPKHFRNSFNNDMQLKESLEGYYRLITERLVKKESSVKRQPTASARKLM